jgi:hypothetical protein
MVFPNDYQTFSYLGSFVYTKYIYWLNPKYGNNNLDGLTPSTAWKTLHGKTINIADKTNDLDFTQTNPHGGNAYSPVWSTLVTVAFRFVEGINFDSNDWCSNILLDYNNLEGGVKKNNLEYTRYGFYFDPKSIIKNINIIASKTTNTQLVDYLTFFISGLNIILDGS